MHFFGGQLHEREIEVNVVDKRTEMESVCVCVCAGGVASFCIWTSNPAPPSDTLTEDHWASAGTSFCCWPSACLIKSFNFDNTHTNTRMPCTPPTTMMPLAHGFAICSPHRHWQLLSAFHFSYFLPTCFSPLQHEERPQRMTGRQLRNSQYFCEILLKLEERRTKINS